MEFGDIKFRLRKIVPVSTTSKIDPICSNYIYLSTNKAATFGRILSEEVQVRLLSKSTPLMISRKHATMYYDSEGESFMVTDHNSANGVYVNSKRIKPGLGHEIKIGDTVAFGCGVKNQSPEFEYTFELTPSTSSKRSENQIIRDAHLSPTKRRRVVDSPSVTFIEASSVQIKHQEEKIKKLSQELSSKENMQKELQNKLQKTESELLTQLQKQRKELEDHRNSAEIELKRTLDAKLIEKEKDLHDQFDKKLKALENDKQDIEQKLQIELSNKLSEKDQLYQQELQEQKLALVQAMFDKENELVAQLKAKDGLIEKYKSVEENQKELELCLLELRKEIQEKDMKLREQENVVSKVESSAKQTVIQTMEDEFTCIICQELFIQATTLPCAHSFCELCLKLWMRKKKNCPVCRRNIRGQAVYSLVLDSAIDKMVESMDDEAKLRRSEIRKERMEQNQKDEATEETSSVRDLIHRPEDDDGEIEGTRNNSRFPRDNYRRRSRSRSPRHHHHRHRPYDNNRFNNNILVGSSSNFHGDWRNSIQRNQQQSRQQYYHQETRYGQSNTVQTNAYNDFQNIYAHQNSIIRCYRCGGTDHIMRFCPRRY